MLNQLWYWPIVRLDLVIVFCLCTVAAWSWCLLANPFVNGILPLFYAVFLTSLLVDRATRDENKCRLKYGKHYERYCKLVPYKILPGLF
jgi:7-dehydrocholesterol reductase